MIDTLIEKIIELQSPVCVGLDTKLDYIPTEFLSGNAQASPLEYAAQNIFAFNRALVDAIRDVAPSVKVQSAYYEMYGPAGVKAFYDTLRYAKEAGLVTIADVKRNDIGATAGAYASAYLGRTDVGGREVPAFDADFSTVNGYLGSDGVLPFVEDCRKYGKGIFVLVKTSNKSSGELQDLIADGKPVYEYMADMVGEWGKPYIGKYGYSPVGAVVGATWPEQARKIRRAHPHLFFLIPGYGAQGGGAADLLPCFDANGLGGVVNNSRAILTAWKNPKYAGMDFAAAARQAVLDMNEDILGAFAKNGVALGGEHG